MTMTAILGLSLLFTLSFLVVSAHAFSSTQVLTVTPLPLRPLSRHSTAPSTATGSSGSGRLRAATTTNGNTDDESSSSFSAAPAAALAAPSETSTSGNSSRRSFLAGSAALASTGAAAAFSTDPALAEDARNILKQKPVCVIGCNGRTGKQCVRYLFDKKEPVRATSRDGAYYAASIPPFAALEKMACDVTDPQSVKYAIMNTKAVIFAASASKSGGTPSAVDNAGLVNVATACLNAMVPHLVIVSSGAVTKPSSPVYLFLNLFGNIMEEKVKGEDKVRQLYALYNSQLEEGQNALTYTIIRPGGLSMDPPRGVEALELNQGDTKSGRLARADVAALCVESLYYPELTGGSTFECYDFDTGAPLASVGLSNIAKKKTDSESFVSGFERRGSTYKELFTGLQKDAGYVRE